MNVKEELRKISVGKQINRNTMQRTEHIAFDEDTLIKFIEKIVGQIEPPVMPKLAEVIKLIELKAKSYNDNKKEDRTRKGVYIDCLVMLKTAIRESNFSA